jgi:signal peptidase II
MNALLIALCLVPLLDQALKVLLRGALGAGFVSLGPLGHLRMVKAQIWWARQPWGPNLAGIWVVWLLSASMMMILTVALPLCGWCAGLLLGGSISHLLETSRQGFVTDYVCLRFWPAFNLADVTITVGAIGLGLAWIVNMKDFSA